MSDIEWIIFAIVIAALSVPILQAFFNFLFRLYHRTENKALLIPLALAFVICDFLANMYSMTILFLEPPREWLVTARLKRWKKLPKDSTGLKKRRRAFAWKKCKELNEYDPGHC